MGKGGHGGHGGHGGGGHRHHGGHGGGHHHHHHGGHLFGHGGHHHHHRHHGPGMGLIGAAALGGMMYSRRMRRGHRGFGRSVVVVSAPPPEPAIVAATEITHYAEQGDHTVYQIRVFSTSGQQWEVAARFSSFETMCRNLEYANIRVPFPGKKPIRSLFGLRDGAKEERRRELDQWLSAVVAVSVVQPWVRRHLHAFLQVPASARAPLAVTTATPTATGGPAPSNQIQVQMPHGVSPGEVLEIEVHGCVYNIPAPGDVAPGATFTVDLPEDEPQIATPYVPPSPGALQQSPQGGGQTMQVVVPAGVMAGQTLTVQAPNGQQVSSVVPPGVLPGQAYMIQMPPSPAEAAPLTAVAVMVEPTYGAPVKASANPF